MHNCLEWSYLCISMSMNPWEVLFCESMLLAFVVWSKYSNKLLAVYFFNHFIYFLECAGFHRLAIFTCLWISMSMNPLEVFLKSTQGFIRCVQTQFFQFVGAHSDTENEKQKQLSLFSVVSKPSLPPHDNFVNEALHPISSSSKVSWNRLAIPCFMIGHPKISYLNNKLIVRVLCCNW